MVIDVVTDSLSSRDSVGTQEPPIDSSRQVEMSRPNLPDALVEEARRGRLVLLLGAGASKGAVSPNGDEPPSGDELRDALSDRFLGGKQRSAPLSWVAELSISETSLSAVQEFIADLLRHLQPAPFHFLLPTFRWHGIATTNYDTVVERAYQIPNRIQDIVPIRSDADRIDELLSGPKDLALLKLHGCITRTRDTDIPFILTTDQYVTHRTHREQLFTTLEEWGREYTVVFVGHAGQDADLRELLLELSRLPDWRPRYYFVKPGVDDTEARLWYSKRVTVIDSSFEHFLSALDVAIPADTRPVLRAVLEGHPIERRLVGEERPSEPLLESLARDLEYVHEGVQLSHGTAQDFYKGFDFEWLPIVSGWDVRRTIADRILNDIILRAEDERPRIAELYTIRAEAGAGKTVLLRRVAWEAATQADVLCIFLKRDGLLQYEKLREIYRLTKQRIFLFVDVASRHVAEIAHVIAEATRERMPITVLAAERQNVWNMMCERLVPLETESLAIRYLSHTEIGVLVDRLKEHGSLGPHLTGKRREECVREFEERAGRQLLVALHEATVGLPFEEILLNEFQQIQPRTAQQLYLTVCVLNRLRVDVRAGLIARVHGIAFEEFSSKFFAPLEHVVRVRQHEGTQDYLYTARHPEIAQIVFERVLDNAVERFNEYTRIIAQLNLAYSSDRQAFRGMMRAKALHDLFPNHQDVAALFRIAEDVAPHEAYLYQQQANYERIRPNGNPRRAEDLLVKARDLDPRDLSIVHTLAEIKRHQAEKAVHPLERARFRKEGRALLQPLTGDPQHGKFARVTLVKLALDELRDVLGEDDASDREVDEAIRVVESQLERAQQQFPDEQFLLTAEAEFGRVLSDSARTRAALEKAFELNPRDPFIASRLGKLLEGAGDLGEAERILATALEGNRGDKQLNFQYAQILMAKGSVQGQVLVYHLRRAFTKWDTNYEAQFWFARWAYESAEPRDREDSREVFRHLREVPLSHDVRSSIRDMVGGGVAPTTFYGRLVKKEFAFGFIEVEGPGDRIFCHRRYVEGWEKLEHGARVQFGVGFSFGGPVALHVRRA